MTTSFLGLQRAVTDCEQAEGKLTLGAEEDGCSKGHDSAWFMPHSQSLHTEPSDVHGLDYSAEEQMVPSSMPYQPYRWALTYTLTHTMTRLNAHEYERVPLRDGYTCK